MSFSFVRSRIFRSLSVSLRCQANPIKIELIKGGQYLKIRLIYSFLG
jgi:hypothetical protein